MMGDERPMSASTGAIKKKRDDKSRRRDHRSWENVLKTANNMPEADKLLVVQEKYTELHNELRKVTSSLQVIEKQCAILQRERDHTQGELTKNILAKAKLESLCRELQKQNKIIKDENITRVKEEEERRREVATNFTEKLTLLTTLMDENKDKSVRLREENMSMTNKLTELYDQFQEREGHLANMNRQLELQKKLSDTQIKKLEVECQNERQLWEQERRMLLENLAKSDEANINLQSNIKSLQDHLDIYKNQYSDFENTMQKSNKVFDAFKDEMSKLQKANALLEKERTEYRTRWQACTNSVVQVSEMQQQTANELKLADRKVQMLEKLCRQLQAERTAYLQQLEENNIKAVIPPPPPEEKAMERMAVAGPSGMSAAAQRRLTKKEKLLVALKSELKSMEDELKKCMTIKQKELATLKRYLKLVVEQRKFASMQQQQQPSREEIEALDRELASSSSRISSLECVSLTTFSEPSTSDFGSFISKLPSSIKSEPQPSTSQAAIQKALSCPQIKNEVVLEDPKPVESPSSDSLDELMTDLSLEAIPLYKPDAFTNLTTTPEIEAADVLEVEGRTNLLVAVPSISEDSSTTPEISITQMINLVMETDTTGEGTTGEGTSQGTISLKEVEGKTEFKEA